MTLVLFALAFVLVWYLGYLQGEGAGYDRAMKARLHVVRIAGKLYAQGIARHQYAAQVRGDR